MNLNLRKCAFEDGDLHYAIFVEIDKQGYDHADEAWGTLKQYLKSISDQFGGSWMDTFELFPSEAMIWYQFPDEERWVEAHEKMMEDLATSLVAVRVTRYVEMYDADDDEWYEMSGPPDPMEWSTPNFPQHIKNRYVPDVDEGMVDET